MRIPSGVTDQYIYFYAVDATDFTTPETGLTGFTVYRSRNGGTAAAFTTPTINETDSSNMPGVYELLLDEDMTIDSGDDEQEMVFHISKTGMAPVVRTITLFRPKITAGETLTVSSGVGSANVTQFGGSNGTFSSGRPEVNATHWGGTAVASATVSANVTQISGSATAADNAEIVFDTDFATNYDTTNDVWHVDVVRWADGAVTASGGYPNVGLQAIKGSTSTVDNVETVFSTDFAANYNTTTDTWNVNATHISGASVSTSSAQIGVNVVSMDSGVVSTIQSGLGTSANQSSISSAISDLSNLIGTPSDFGSGTSTIAANLQDIADNGTATYDRSTDSLQAIRDRGDAAWTTGAGGTPPDLLVDTTIATLSSQTSFTLTAGSADDNAYNGAILICTDQSTSTQKAVGLVSDYVGSTKTITLSADPGIFTMATGDTIQIVAATGTGPSAAAIRAEIDSNSTQLAAIVADTNELQTDWVNGGRLDLIVDAILADTNELQTNQGNWLTATGFSTHSAADVVTAMGTGTFLTAIPWNAAWDAEVQSECTDALNAYDPPTNTEMTAAFTEIKGATWATTDTLEAIRDRGDAAWVTATSVTVSDKTGFKLASDGLDLVTAWTVDITGSLSGSVGSVTGAVGSVTGNVGGNVVGSVGSVTGGINTSGGTITTLDALDTAQDSQHATTQSATTAIEADTQDIQSRIPAALVNSRMDCTIDGTGMESGAITAIWSAALTEAYRSTGATGTATQLLYEILQNLTEFAISGTTKTVKKLDGSTTAKTYTLDDDTTPTSITEAT